MTTATMEPLGQQEQPSRMYYRFRSSSSLILATVCVAMFNDVFLFRTIIPILPYDLPQRIHVDEDDVQIWIVVLLATYAGALLMGSLVFGWVGDRLSRRHSSFLFGILMLLIATVLFSVGRHLVTLVFGRLLQGLAAALVWTIGLALLTDTFGQQRYGEAVGYAHASVIYGTTSAPLLGGVVYARGGFSAVSAMSFGVVALSIALALMMIEPKTETGLNEPASPAHLFSVGGINNRTIVSEEVSRKGRSEQSPTRIEPASDLPDERSALIRKYDKEGNLRNRPAYLLLLRSGRFLAAMGGIFAYAVVIVSFDGMIPLFMKETFHWGSTRVALIFLTWIIPGFLGPIAGMASDRLGPRWIVVGGFLFAVPPLILMRLVTKDCTSHKVLICGLLALVGFGLAWVTPLCISDLSAAATELKSKYPHEFGDSGASSQAFGLYLFSYSCGFLVGPTLIGIIKSNAGWSAATLALAFVCAAACIPIMLKTPSSPHRRHAALGSSPNYDALANPDH